MVSDVRIQRLENVISFIEKIFLWKQEIHKKNWKLLYKSFWWAKSASFDQLDLISNPQMLPLFSLWRCKKPAVRHWKNKIESQGLEVSIPKKSEEKINGRSMTLEEENQKKEDGSEK